MCWAVGQTWHCMKRIATPLRSVPPPCSSQKVSSEFSTCLVIHNFQKERNLAVLNNPFKIQNHQEKKHLCRHRMARPRVEASTADSFQWLFQLAPLTLGALWFLESNLRFLAPKHLGFFWEPRQIPNKSVCVLKRRDGNLLVDIIHQTKHPSLGLKGEFPECK